jgi:hypothetical protein
MSPRLSPSPIIVAAFDALTTACAHPPAELDLSLQHPSSQGRFVVRMEPPETGSAVRQMHAWQIRLSTPEGAPVPQATIAFEGGMPQHGHGFPTKPRVTGELAPGVYALEGVKFSMTGWWDMRLAIRAGEVADAAVFNVIVDETGVRR